MSTIVINTSEVKKKVDLLVDEKKYFYDKKSVFTSTSFKANDIDLLEKYILKVNGIYADISNNIESLSNYLSDYLSDVEGLENLMCNKGGFIKETQVRSIVNSSKNSISTSFIDESNLFDIVSYNSGANIGSNGVNYDEVDPIKRRLATAGISVLAFIEGVGNVGEMFVDGLGVAASGVCTIFGATDTAEDIMGWVKKDVSGDIYHKVVSASGLDKYGNPDGAIASGARMAGNIVGMVGLTIVTAGAASGITGAAVGAGVVSTETSAVVAGGLTVGLNAGVSAVRDAGSAAEIAMQRGASVSEAELVALNSAGIGAVTGGLTGKLNVLAKGASGVGQVIEYGLASFAVGSSDPLLNQISHTIIYEHDDNLNFFENFLQNAKNDGLLIQMGISGVASSCVTVWNGYKGISNFDDLLDKIEEGNKVIASGGKYVIEINSIDEFNPKLFEFMEDADSFVIRYANNNYSVTSILLAQENKSVIQDIVLRKVKELVPEFENAKNFSEVYEIASNVLGSKIQSVTNSTGFKAASDILTAPLSLYGRIKNVDVTSDVDFSNKILNEGLYHITSASSADLILDSGYVRASDYLVSYGQKKSFFFAGTPTMEDAAMNLNTFSPTQVAIKIDIDESDLSSLRYRAVDDCAVTHLGDFRFDQSRARLVYLGLFDDNGSLVYKEISKEQFDSYDMNLNLGRTISQMQYTASGFARQFDYTVNRLNSGYELLLNRLGFK